MPRSFSSRARLLRVSLVLWFGFIGWASPRAMAQSWTSISVPGRWPSPGGNPGGGGGPGSFGWYRAWFKPHDSFFTPHERNLFTESVSLNIRDLATAHEAFLNGQRIGGAGGFPPNPKSGREGHHRYKIPPGLLRKGEWNEIALRVYRDREEGGFLGEAPFVMDYFNECVLEGDWEIRWGDDPGWRGGARIEKPARATFEQYRESSRVLAEAAEVVPGQKLPPVEAWRRLQPEREFVVEPLLAEPLVAQPVHLSFDERGRLWVSQYRQYPFPAGLKMLSRDKFYRAQYDRVPAPPPRHDRGRDLISIHEDLDGDGVYDRHKVFQDGLNLANAAVRGRGGVWVMHTPYLLFYPDADGDDVPDGPPVVHLAGFGIEDTHSVANGLVWGMDGWLYGAQGSTCSCRVIRPGLDPENDPGVRFESAMVWRYHPKSRRFEIFAEGGGNTFGLEVDSEGRIFSGHNGGETRGWYFVQGGYYLKQGFDPGKFGPPRNPYLLGQLSAMPPQQPVQRFSHFFAIGEGTALPSGYQGSLFSIDPIHSLVTASQRLPKGSGFETSDRGPVLTSADEGFRPVFIVNAPDGSLFLADFYEHYIAHGQHFQSQIDASSGRIYRLRGKDARLENDLNLAAKSSRQLVGFLNHPNKWHRQTAVRLLGERADLSVRQELRTSLQTGLLHASLGALWSLHQAGWLEEEDYLRALAHPQPMVRAWAVRLAGDRWGANPGLGSKVARTEGLPTTLLTRLSDLARNESSSEVRLQIAASLRRLPFAQAVVCLPALLAHAEDRADALLPLMCWWIVEAQVGPETAQVLEFFRDPRRWEESLTAEDLFPRLMKRFALEGRRQDFLHCAELLQNAPGDSARHRLARAFEEATRGRPLTAVPEELGKALSQSGANSLSWRLRRREPAAIEEALAALANPQIPVEARLELVRTLGEETLPKAVDPLLSLATRDPDLPIRRAALSALGAYGDERIAPSVVQGLEELPASLRPAAFALILGRVSWTRQLVDFLERTPRLRGLVPIEAVDRLRHYPEEGIRRRSGKLWASSPASDPELAPRLRRVEDALRGGSGNPYAGETLFTARCAGCHRLFHKGGNVGPDLTPYQRDHLGTLLTSILAPSAEIREGYLSVEVEMKDERLLNGFIADQDAELVVLRSLDGANTALRRKDIVRLEASGRSLMPDGLLDDLVDQQLRDLFAYLRSSQPITKP